MLIGGRGRVFLVVRWIAFWKCCWLVCSLSKSPSRYRTRLIGLIAGRVLLTMIQLLVGVVVVVVVSNVGHFQSCCVGSGALFAAIAGAVGDSGVGGACAVEALLGALSLPAGGVGGWVRGDGWCCG